MAYGAAACGTPKEPDATPKTRRGHLPDTPVLLQGHGQDSGGTRRGMVQTEDGAIQHIRAAVQEADHARDQEVEKVRYELEMEEHPERPRTRLTGKQSLIQALSWSSCRWRMTW